MYQLTIICAAGFLLVSSIPQITNGSPLSFLRNRVQEEADEEAAIEQNEIDRDVVVAPAVVLPQTRQSQKGKKRISIINKERLEISESPPGMIKAPLRSYVELECEAIGSPTPQIHWLRGADPLRQLDELMGNSIAEISTTPRTSGGLLKIRSRLVIDCVSLRDQGVIHCAAVSGGRTVLSNPTMLLINEHSTANGSSCGLETKPRVTLNSPIALGLIGTRLTLPCRASGRPRPPRTLWLDNDDEPITANSNPRFKILSSGELVIFPLDWEDMGGFTCIAQSERGEDAATTFLYPLAENNDSS